MFCGQQVPFSETWPASGTTLGGRLYPLPKPGPRTFASACSSSPGLLPTPNATDGQGGIRAVPERRTHNGPDHGPRLRDFAPTLLKTPTAQLAVNGGSQHPDKRREGGHGPTLADQVEHELLPTPAARDWKSGQSNIMDRNARPLNEVIVNLLPTPMAADGGWTGDESGKGARASSSGYGLRNTSREISRGELTDPPSNAGNPLSAADPPGQLSLDGLANG